MFFSSPLSLSLSFLLYLSISLSYSLSLSLSLSLSYTKQLYVKCCTEHSRVSTDETSVTEGRSEAEPGLGLPTEN